MPANVSVEFSASGEGNADLDLLFTPQDGCGLSGAHEDSCDDYEIRLSGRFAWLKMGAVNATNVTSASLSLNVCPYLL